MAVYRGIDSRGFLYRGFYRGFIMKKQIGKKELKHRTKHSGNAGKKKSRIIRIAAAVLLSLILAFAADYLVYTGSDHRKTVGEETSSVFTEGQDAFAIMDCMIVDNEVVITGADPQFCVMAPGNEVSEVHILFGEPLAQETGFQLFYAIPGGSFCEEDSVRLTFAEGSEEEFVRIPEARYSRFRFDFEENVRIREILSGNMGLNNFAYTPYAVRIIFFTLEFLALLAAVYFFAVKRNRENAAAGESPRRRRSERNRKRIAAFAQKKPLFAVLLCNLFLSMTVVFFQPLAYGLFNVIEFPFDSLWGGQLLIALGFTLVLSALMLLLPARGGRIAAAVSLGAGIAFLAQSLLLNEGRPLAMNADWLMKMENIFVWFSIVVVSIAAMVYFSGSEGKKAEKVICLIACVLIVMQAMSFTILGTSREQGYRRLDYDPQEELSGETGFAELMNISLERGLPFFLKPADQNADAADAEG